MLGTDEVKSIVALVDELQHTIADFRCLFAQGQYRTRNSVQRFFTERIVSLVHESIDVRLGTSKGGKGKQVLLGDLNSMMQPN